MKQIIITFPFISFSFDYLFNSKLFLICFLQLVIVKQSNNFFSLKVCLRNSVFDFFNHKKPQTNLYFDILTLSPTLNFGFLSLISLLKLIFVWFYINRFHFNCVMICIIIFINYII